MKAKRGRPCLGARAMTSSERSNKRRTRLLAIEKAARAVVKAAQEPNPPSLSRRLLALQRALG
jgi:hypothetical protein